MAACNLREEQEEIMDRELVCSICTEIFSNPRSLECGHDFCLDCLEKDVQARSRDGYYPCPICRRPIAVPPDGPKQFLCNVIVKNLVDSVKQHPANRERCDRCHECIARLVCLTCDNTMICISCKKQHQNETNCHKIVRIEKVTEIHERRLVAKLHKVTSKMRSRLDLHVKRNFETRVDDLTNEISELKVHDKTPDILKSAKRLNELVTYLNDDLEQALISGTAAMLPIDDFDDTSSEHLGNTCSDHIVMPEVQYLPLYGEGKQKSEAKGLLYALISLFFTTCAIMLAAIRLICFDFPMVLLRRVWYGTSSRERSYEQDILIPCRKCKEFHRTLFTGLSCWYFCVQCGATHKATTGEAWLEVRICGFQRDFHFCIGEKVYNINEWASCCEELFRNARPNTHFVYIFPRISDVLVNQQKNERPPREGCATAQSLRPNSASNGNQQTNFTKTKNRRNKKRR